MHRCVRHWKETAFRVYFLHAYSLILPSPFSRQIDRQNEKSYLHLYKCCKGVERYAALNAFPACQIWFIKKFVFVYSAKVVQSGGLFHIDLLTDTYSYNLHDGIVWTLPFTSIAQVSSGLGLWCKYMYKVKKRYIFRNVLPGLYHFLSFLKIRELNFFLTYTFILTTILLKFLQIYTFFTTDIFRFLIILHLTFTFSPFITT